MSLPYAATAVPISAPVGCGFSRYTIPSASHSAASASSLGRVSLRSCCFGQLDKIHVQPMTSRWRLLRSSCNEPRVPERVYLQDLGYQMLSSWRLLLLGVCLRNISAVNRLQRNHVSPVPTLKNVYSQTHLDISSSAAPTHSGSLHPLVQQLSSSDGGLRMQECEPDHSDQA